MRVLVYSSGVEVKKLGAYKNDGSSFSSATEFDMGYFGNLRNLAVVKGRKFKRIGDGGIRITNPKSYLANTNSYDDSYDNAIYVGDTKVICSSYLDFVPKLNRIPTYEQVDATNFKLDRVIYFHPKSGWASDENKDSNFRDLDLSEMITLTTYGDYLDFFGGKWDPVEKKAVPK